MPARDHAAEFLPTPRHDQRIDGGGGAESEIGARTRVRWDSVDVDDDREVASTPDLAFGVEGDDDRLSIRDRVEHELRTVAVCQGNDHERTHATSDGERGVCAGGRGEDVRFGARDTTKGDEKYG